MKSLLTLLVVSAIGVAAHQSNAGLQLLGGRAHLDAHNAYPDEGQHGDRIERALATGLSPFVIEQDVAFRKGVSVVSHDAELDGTEPTLEHYFFDRVRPMMDAALKSGHKSNWPLVVMHLDFKTNEREHHRAVWDVLLKHRAWLTTASAGAGVTPFQVGPLLVLTENGENQERDFTEWATAAGTHLLFGTIPGPAVAQTKDEVERARLLVNAPPSSLIPAPATSYRRWVNFPWAVIEEGGPTKANDWTSADAARLASVVRYAHEQGLWIRFYTLNGHGAAESRGWSAGYNFGTLAAARRRWEAAVKAGVDLIATDQYEQFAEMLQTRR